MRSVRPPRRRRSNHSQTVVFILGILIGASLMYSFHPGLRDKEKDSPLETPEEQEQTPPVTEGETPVATVEPEEDAPETEVEPVPAATESVPPDVADLGGLWPARHVFIGIEGTALSAETQDLLARFKPGGVVLRAGNIVDEAQTKALAEAIKAAVSDEVRLGGLPLVAVAQVGGETPEDNPLGLENAPSPRVLAEAGDQAALEEIAQSYGVAALSRGIGVILAPILDVYSPDTAETSWRARTFGDSPDVVVKYGMPFLQALGETGAIAVAKYYPGAASATSGAAGLTLEREDIGELAQLLFPFSEAASAYSENGSVVRAAVPGLLAAHVAVPGLDRDHPERPASQSPVLIQEVVRDQLGYEGVLLSDDVSGTECGQRMVHALAAGCDGVLLLEAGADALESLCAAVRDAAQGDNAVLTLADLSIHKARLDGWGRRLSSLEAQYPMEAPPPPEEPGVAEDTSGNAAPAEEAPAPAPEEIKSAESTDEDKPTPPETVEPPAEAEQEPSGDETPEKENPETGAEDVPEKAEGETPKETPEETPEATGQAEDETLKETPEATEQAESETPEEAPKAAETTDSTAALEGVTPEEEGNEAPVAAETSEEEAAQPDERTETNEDSSSPASPPGNTKLLRHRVSRGETLTSVSKQYGVSIEDIKAWNGMKSSQINYGAQLKIYLPVAEESEAVSEEGTAP